MRYNICCIAHEQSQVIKTKLKDNTTDLHYYSSKNFDSNIIEELHI